MALNSGGGGGSAGAVRAGAAFVEIFTRNNLAVGLNSASKDLKAFGGRVTGLGRAFLGLGAVGGAALGGVFKAAVGRSAEFGALSLKFGDSAENLSALGYAAETASTDQADLWAAFKRWPSVLEEAKTAGSGAAEMFATLGLDAAKLSKIGLTDQFLAVSDAMQSIGDNSQRLDTLQNLFGKSGGGLNEFIGLGSKGIREMMEEAGRVGAVVGQEQAEQAKRIEDQFTKAWKAVKYSVLSVGDALLPTENALTAIGDNIVAAAQASRQWISENREVVLGVGAAVGGVSALGLGMMALGPAIKGLAASWGIFTGVVVAGKALIAGTMAIISAPILALPAALAAAGGAWLAFTEDGRATATGWASSIKDALQPTIDNFTSSFSMMVKQFQSGDLGGAFRTGLDAVRVEWARLMLFFEQTWTRFSVGWEKQIDELAIALTRLGKKYGLYTAQEAADIEKNLRDMGKEAQVRLENPQSLKEAKFELWRAEAWQKFNREELAKAMEQQGITAKMREAFAMLRGAGGADNPLGRQIATIQMASRGTFGGGASTGFFGGSGGVGERLIAAANKGNEIGERANKLLAQIAAGGGVGGMRFAVGK